VTSKTIIIPAPQHEGHAIYTRQMAEIIADNVGCRVADVLISRPRKPLYELKKDGTLYKEPLEFMLTERVEGDEIFFLDNVLATGTTFQAANRLFKRKLKPLIYAEARI
jgi:predicted amidophosphoribosyltransferase